MLQKLNEFIKHLDYHELRVLQDSLDKEQENIKTSISKEISKYEYKKTSFCAVCGSKLDESQYVYTLVFGPEDFQKKASFCGLDCMEYFLSYIKRLNEQNHTKKHDLIEKEYF